MTHPIARRGRELAALPHAEQLRIIAAGAPAGPAPDAMLEAAIANHQTVEAFTRAVLDWSGREMIARRIIEA